jgi:MFS family permease
MLQALVIPALPVLQHDLNTSVSGVAWIFTSFLISASVATPVLGRFGDMFGKRRMLVIVLAFQAATCVLAALATTLPVMLVARTLQGVGGATFPLGFGIIRDEFPLSRVPGAIALMSGVFGIGGTLGIVFAGPIVDNLSYHWLFWLPGIVMAVVALATLLIVPESPVRAPGRIHWLGAVLLMGWLLALLLAVSQGPVWGWSSARIVGLFVAAAALCAVWVLAESRSEHPLVDMHMLRLRPVWATNLVTLLMGYGLYSSAFLVSKFVQAPTSTGYGFGLTVTQAGLFLLPSSLGMLIFSPIGGRLSSTVGSKVPLVLGVAIMSLSFVILAVADSKPGIIVGSTVGGIGGGFAFASVANLIVQAVRVDQTGVATGMNTILRTIGSAFGAVVAASVLAAATTSGAFPSQHGYTVSYTLGAIVLAVAVLVSLFVPGRLRRSPVAAIAPTLGSVEP